MPRQSRDDVQATAGDGLLESSAPILGGRVAGHTAEDGDLALLGQLERNCPPTLPAATLSVPMKRVRHRAGNVGVDQQDLDSVVDCSLQDRLELPGSVGRPPMR